MWCDATCSRDFAITHLVCFLSQAPFGVYVVLARGSVADVWPGVLITLRFAGGFLVLFTYHYTMTGRNMIRVLWSMPSRLRTQIVWSGVLAIMSPVCFVFGLRYTSAVVAGAIDASSPAVAAGIALLLRSDSLRSAEWACLALSLLGNSFVLEFWQGAERYWSSGPGPEGHRYHDSDAHRGRSSVWHTATGLTLVLASCVLSVSNYSLQKPIMRLVPPLDLVTHVVFVGFVLSCGLAVIDLGAFGVLLQQQQSWLTWGMVAYAVLLQGWSHNWLVSVAVHRSSPLVVSMYTTMIPAISAALAYLWLNEYVSTSQIVGMVLVTLSVGISALSTNLQAEPTEKKSMTV